MTDGVTTTSNPPSGWAYRIRLGADRAPADFDRTMVWAIVALLTCFGLIMVLSSSAVESFAAGDGVSSKFIKQFIFATIGFLAMYFTSKLPMTFWTGHVATLLLVVTIILQLLVFTPLGVTLGGNRAWLNLGFTTLQPAEIGKLAMSVWIARIVTIKRKPIVKWQHLLVPVLLPALTIIGLALAGKDLGTVMVMGALLLGCLWFSDMPAHWTVVGGIVAAGGAVLMAAISPNRVRRITEFFSGECDYLNGCWQTSHGFYALAHGGLLGVGLGNSTAKWSWLPEADNDYIFAIIGEEFGLFGAVVVLLIFLALALVLLRLWKRAKAAGARVIIGGVFTWIFFQAFVNIAVVVGLLPVLGVPLPFVSSGGSALVTTLLAMGIVLSVAKSDSASVNSRRTPKKRKEPVRR